MEWRRPARDLSHPGRLVLCGDARRGPRRSAARATAFACLFPVLLAFATDSRGAAVSDPSADRRPVVCSPPQDLAALEVKKDCLSTNAQTVGVRFKTLSFTVKPSDCFIYAAPEGFEYLAVKDLQPGTQQGEPQVPMKTFLVVLDKDAEVCGVEVVAGSFAKVQGKVRIAPSPKAAEPNWTKLISGTSP